MKPGRARNMIGGLCQITDGLICLVSLGGYHAALTFKFFAWAELRDIRKRMEEREKEKT